MIMNEQGHDSIEKCLLFKPENIRNYSFYFGRGVGIWWLGQAGFIIRSREITILIDPYLSNVLASKYMGKKYPHIRMMAAPIDPENLIDIDYYISTHSHSDHMDPGLIPIIIKNNPECIFILPEAIEDIGLDRGILKNKMVLMDDRREIILKENISIFGVASAHEELVKDSLGHNVFLGYIIKFGNKTIYHSGDCVPYPGIKRKLEPFGIDLALLPVNGRSNSLSNDGIAGNFNISEALNLVDELKIPFLIPHHYGMFRFNTVDMKDLKNTITKQSPECMVYPAELDLFYKLEGINE
jgi:L-ascorbate metabolism protein UlaG (beta-lactamase superfamily)